MSVRSRIFLSYSRADLDQVDRLYKWLRRQGFTPFIDHDIAGGDKWAQRLEKEIHNNDIFMVCATQNSLSSEYVKEEIALALKIEQVKEPGFIFPVKLQPCELPASIAGYEWVDLGQKGGWRKLRRSLPIPPIPRWWFYAAGLIASVILIAAVSILNRLSEPDLVRLTRITGPAIASLKEPRIGLTFWRVRPAVASDPDLHGRNLKEPKPDGGKTILTAVRVTTNTAFRVGAKIRLGIQSTRSGFLYIVGQEYHKNAQSADLRLIYPTEYTLGRGNLIAPGVLVGLPDNSAAIPYWEAERKESDYGGETLTILLLPQRMTALDELAASKGQPIIEGELAARILKLREIWSPRTQLVSSGKGGSIETPGEAGARQGSTELGLADPPPETIYKAEVGASDPVVVTVPITIVE